MTSFQPPSPPTSVQGGRRRETRLRNEGGEVDGMEQRKRKRTENETIYSGAFRTPFFPFNLGLTRL